MSLKAVDFGWKIAALVVLGTTIFVSSNTRKRIEPVDEVELVMGGWERAYLVQVMLSQRSTNSYPHHWNTNGDFVFSPTYSMSAKLCTETNVFLLRMDRVFMETYLDGLIGYSVPAFIAPTSKVIKVYNPFKTNDPWVYTNKYPRWQIGPDIYTNPIGQPWIAIWTSNIFTHAGIGDYTNKWTLTPGWTGSVSGVHTATFSPKVHGPAYFPDMYLPDAMTRGGDITYDLHPTNGDWHRSWVDYEGTPSNYAARVYEGALVERYKTLYYLRDTKQSTRTNSGDIMVSNSVIYVWYKAADIPGVGVSWDNVSSKDLSWTETNMWYGVYPAWYAGYDTCWYPGTQTTLDMDDPRAWMMANWAAAGSIAPPEGPPESWLRSGVFSGYSVYHYWYYFKRQCRARASFGQIKVGPFNNSPPHSFIVEGCTIGHPFGGYYGGNNQIGTSEGEWQVIYSVLGSTNTYDSGPYYGSVDFPEWIQPSNAVECFGIGYHVQNYSAVGNVWATRITAAYDPYQLSHWVQNNSPEAISNNLTIPGFTNHQFKYCTNKFW